MRSASINSIRQASVLTRATRRASATSRWWARQEDGCVVARGEDLPQIFVRDGPAAIEDHDAYAPVHRRGCRMTSLSLTFPRSRSMTRPTVGRQIAGQLVLANGPAAVRLGSHARVRSVWHLRSSPRNRSRSRRAVPRSNPSHLAVAGRPFEPEPDAAGSWAVAWKCSTSSARPRRVASIASQPSPSVGRRPTEPPRAG